MFFHITMYYVYGFKFPFELGVQEEIYKRYAENRIMAEKDEAGADEKYCSSCGEVINEEAEICPECGVRQKTPSSDDKDRTTAGILAILLGSFGAHKFYLEETGLGLLYLCFCWTGIPGLIGLIEGIIYLTKSDEEFQARYG